jgi:hypothetical protein
MRRRKSKFLFVAMACMFALCAASSAQQPSERGKSPESASRLYSESISTTLEDADRVATIFAVIAGGVWVYFNFMRGRTYRPRLELDVSAATHRTQPASVLSATIRVRNVGLSRVRIRKEGTVCIVSAPERIQLVETPTVITDWVRLNVSHILTDHHSWIEPGETITQQRLIILPLDTQAICQVEARVVASQGIEWNACVVVVPGLPH